MIPMAHAGVRAHSLVDVTRRHVLRGGCMSGHERIGFTATQVSDDRSTRDPPQFRASARRIIARYRSRDSGSLICLYNTHIRSIGVH